MTVLELIDALPEVGRLADWLGLVGFVITIGGFGLTLRNVARAKDAARQAERAATEARDGIARFNLLTDVSQAMAVLDECKRLLRARSFVLLPDRFTELRRVLVGVKHTHSRMTDVQAIAIQDMIKLLALMEARFVGHEQDGSDPSDVIETHKALSQMVDNLQIILLELLADPGS